MQWPGQPVPARTLFGVCNQLIQQDLQREEDLALRGLFRACATPGEQMLTRFRLARSSTTYSLAGEQNSAKQKGSRSTDLALPQIETRRRIVDFAESDAAAFAADLVFKDDFVRRPRNVPAPCVSSVTAPAIGLARPRRSRARPRSGSCRHWLRISGGLWHCPVCGPDFDAHATVFAVKGRLSAQRGKTARRSPTTTRINGRRLNQPTEVRNIRMHAPDSVSSENCRHSNESTPVAESAK